MIKNIISTCNEQISPLGKHVITGSIFKVSYFQFVVCLHIHSRAGDIINEKSE